MIVAAVDREEIDALDDLKATNQIITSSLQNDLLLLQSKHKNLTTDYEQQKSHLVDALLAKDKLRQELAIMKEGKDSAGEVDRQAVEEKSKALQALKEVSHEIESSDRERSSRWLAPHRLSSYPSFHPYVAETEPLQSIAQIDEASLLSLERQAIGFVRMAEIGDVHMARHISLPMSPLKTNTSPKQIFRTKKWTEDEWPNYATVTDNICSKPRNKKSLFKTFSGGSSWPRRRE
jgi:protein HOOK3